MTAQWYVHDILQPHVLPLMQWLPGAVFKQGNARPYTARLSQEYLHTVTALPWPARPPDLSLIKHIWDHLGRRVAHPTSLSELEARLQQIWNEMSQDIIQNLYASMPDRIASCICARGEGSPRSSYLKPTLLQVNFYYYDYSAKPTQMIAIECRILSIVHR
ncbi:transposable element Tcb1 transposase [Trichonephila clavipes]|nr:transposable element Tcb1 transposase [Trichonephila clavipes]